MTDYPRPALTVDVVAFRWARRLEVLLIRRGKDPFAGHHALPGGYVEPDEPTPNAAVRELEEETGVRVDPAALRIVGAYGGPGRDPRGWTVSAAYAAVLSPKTTAAGADDATEAGFFPVAALPPLAFDHAEIIRAAQGVLAERVQIEPWAFGLLGPGFRSAQARALCAALLERPVPPRPFKAWIRRRGVVERVGKSRYSPTAAFRPDWLR
jgi:8-oxo-dGTP diphosphatase